MSGTEWALITNKKISRPVEYPERQPKGGLQDGHGSEALRLLGKKWSQSVVFFSVIAAFLQMNP
jgi:hypothetical protein